MFRWGVFAPWGRKATIRRAIATWIAVAECSGETALARPKRTETTEASRPRESSVAVPLCRSTPRFPDRSMRDRYRQKACGSFVVFLPHGSREKNVRRVTTVEPKLTMCPSNPGKSVVATRRILETIQFRGLKPTATIMGVALRPAGMIAISNVRSEVRPSDRSGTSPWLCCNPLTEVGEFSERAFEGLWRPAYHTGQADGERGFAEVFSYESGWLVHSQVSLTLKVRPEVSPHLSAAIRHNCLFYKMTGSPIFHALTWTIRESTN